MRRGYRRIRPRADLVAHARLNHLRAAIVALSARLDQVQTQADRADGALTDLAGAVADLQDRQWPPDPRS